MNPRWLVHVTTCPRGQPTLGATLDSLAAAGWPIVEVYSDRNKTGARRNFCRSLSHALAKKNWDFLLACQDDVLMDAGIRRWLESHATPSGVKSLWLPSVHLQRGKRGWWRLATDELPRKAYGALAYVLDRRVCETIVSSRRRHSHPHKVDWFVGAVCKDSGIRYWYYERTFCEHIGHTSAVDPERNPEINLIFRSSGRKSLAIL